MNSDELKKELSARNTYIRELKTLVKDLLGYEHIITCSQCKEYRKKDEHCMHWNRKQVDYGFCNYGVRK